MAITLLNLAEGQVPSSSTTVYTVPASTTAVTLSCIFHNTDVAARDVQMLIDTGASDRQLFDINIAAGASYIFAERVVLDTTFAIKVNASVASVVDYVLSGLEVT